MKPCEVNAQTHLDAYTHIALFDKKHRFNVGDVVRIITNPVTYLLEDMKGKPILGGFYEQELQKVKYPDVYLVERVLRRKNDKVYVKWWGLNENSWIDKNNIV
ncbi:hypothetical protein RI129_000337 [Pyrocoelia pectoralis]|uniref:Chromo domain-containing protein n=1 Tax=Pyrocoelia pectoralis TaxID=417401 RepID=A0AAN7VSL2_9COLE